MTPETRIVSCEHCDGTGSIETDRPTPWSPLMFVCPECEGVGEIEVEVAPIEADDLGDWVSP